MVECIERSRNKITYCLAVMLHLSPIVLSTMRHCVACKLIVRACDVSVSNGREVMSVDVTLRPSLVIKIKLASGCQPCKSLCPAMRPGRALTHLVRVFRWRARNVSLTRAFTRPFPHHLLCRAPSLGAPRPALRKIPKAKFVSCCCS